MKKIIIIVAVLFCVYYASAQNTISANSFSFQIGIKFETIPDITIDGKKVSIDSMDIHVVQKDLMWNHLNICDTIDENAIITFIYQKKNIISIPYKETDMLSEQDNEVIYDGKKIVFKGWFLNFLMNYEF